MSLDIVPNNRFNLKYCLMFSGDFLVCEVQIDMVPLDRKINGKRIIVDMNRLAQFLRS